MAHLLPLPNPLTTVPRIRSGVSIGVTPGPSVEEEERRESGLLHESLKKTNRLVFTVDEVVEGWQAQRLRLKRQERGQELTNASPAAVGHWLGIAAGVHLRQGGRTSLMEEGTELAVDWDGV